MVHKISYSPFRVARVVIQQEGGILLVHSRRSHQWEFPGGQLKHRETYEIAALRELREETGITLKHVTYRGTVRHDVAYSTGEHTRFLKQYFFAIVCDLIIGTPEDEEEIIETRWFKEEEISSLTSLSPEAREVSVEMKKRSSRLFKIIHTTVF